MTKYENAVFKTVETKGYKMINVSLILMIAAVSFVMESPASAAHDPPEDLPTLEQCLSNPGSNFCSEQLAIYCSANPTAEVCHK